MRIALKPVTTNASTTDTAPSKSSGGSSFLDILFQGTTQDAVQGTKPVGSQTHSDAQSSDHPSSDDQAAQNSTQNATSARDQVAAPSDQATTPAKTNSSGNQQGGQPAASSTQNNAQPSDPSLPNLAKLDATYLFAKNPAAVVASDAAQAGSSAANSGSTSASSATGKQGGASKVAQGKQTVTVPATADASVLQQALAAIQQVIPVPTPAPQASVVPQLAPITQGATTDPTTDGSSQTTALPNGTQAASLLAAASATASAPSANTQAQQPASGTTSAGNTPFLHDLAAIAANTLKANAAITTPDAVNNAQAAQPKPVQTSDQAFNQAGANQLTASTFFSAAMAQNDNVSTQTTGKPISLKVAATNLGTNATAGTAGTTSTSATTTPSVNAAQTAKNTSQDSSNSSTRDGQAGSDTASSAQTDSTQLPNATVHTDTSAQAFVLNATSSHATTQSGPSTSEPDPTPSHVTGSRNLQAESANTSLPAGSSAINTARVIQNMNETEMRVGMRSTEFGDISIRTMVTQQQMQTQISVDHSELVSALSAHIPSLQAKLGADYGLHASIEVSQGGASFSNNQGQSSQRDYKPFTTSTQTDATAPLADTDRMIARPVAAAVVLEGSRLDIRA